MPQSVYKIQEIFYSLQGEGANVGKPVVFIRFTGCNLHCPFCDTLRLPGTKLSSHQIYQTVKQIAGRCKAIIFTGGEPLLQLDQELLHTFQGWWLGLESNGTQPLLEGFDYVTISPKAAPLDPSVLSQRVNEVRVAVKKNDRPGRDIDADHYYVSPIFDGYVLNQENLDWAIEFCKENPEWKLSIQLHKLIKIL